MYKLSLFFETGFPGAGARPGRAGGDVGDDDSMDVAGGSTIFDVSSTVMRQQTKVQQ